MTRAELVRELRMLSTSERAAVVSEVDDETAATDDLAYLAPATRMVILELRKSQKAIEGLYAQADPPKPPPQRRTRLAYASPGSEADVVHSIASQISDVMPLDPEKDVTASTAAELNSAIASAMGKLRPGRAREMSGDARPPEQAPILRRRMGECFGSPSDPITGWIRGE